MMNLAKMGATLVAVFLVCFVGNTAANDAVLLEDHEGIRVWHGTELKGLSLKSSDLVPPIINDDKIGSGSATTQERTDPIVKIASQPPIHKAGYRIRCKSRRASSCPLSAVVVDVFNQPAIRRVRGLPSATVWIGTETRNGEAYAIARVFRRGVPVHQAGIPDNWRIRNHTAGVSSDQNVPVNRAGLRNNRNIRVKRAGVSNNRNIRVKRAGVSNNPYVRER
jgi:hypothetical protein